MNSPRSWPMCRGCWPNEEPGRVSESQFRSAAIGVNGRSCFSRTQRRQASEHVLRCLADVAGIRAVNDSIVGVNDHDLVVEAALLFGLSDRPERMQSRPIPRVRPLRPAPEAAPAQIGAFIIPKLMTEVDRVSAAFVDH